MEIICLALALVALCYCTDRLVDALFKACVKRDGILEWYPSPPRRHLTSPPSAPSRTPASLPALDNAPFWPTPAELPLHSR
ncbi:MAG: hypothetical protein A2091_13190 [Desulfuromonadales bacterium GWD2_61_12]|nr:MAG: hypothetical protein A2005_03700 [Desulfuromonadales bacterium GWC2_61_20]OGR35492.1 MAG: hypothetical protein A2091_13190 [Desulfuromonadales bacterium GWD2_61_12]HAD04589.1 hypothetical protein [Desulfuromonas sp.]HBT83178.1 hypothetical protein [Desulfuromonas sp.]